MVTPTSDLRREAPIDLRAAAEQRAADFSNYADAQEALAQSLAADAGNLPETQKAVAVYLEGAAFMRETAALLDLLAAEVA